MTRTISLPLWAAVLLVVLAAWAALDRLLVPSVRWYLRRRVQHVIDELNTRLKLEIPQFHRTRRRVLIDRLVFDPKVVETVDATAREQGIPRAVLAGRVERYAREIVPAFNAYFYFRIGYWLSKRVARLLYRVRLGFSDEAGLAGVTPGSTVVFLMNHRSNMDYILVAYLAADRTALSYAVGEWARVWPLQTLIRSTGALLRAPQLGRSPLPAGAGALHPHGDGSRRAAGGLPGRRIVAGRPAASAEARHPRLHAALLRSSPRRPGPGVHSGWNQLRPGAGGPHAAPRSRAGRRGEARPPARRLDDPALHPAQPGARDAQPLAPLRLRLRELRQPHLDAPSPGRAGARCAHSVARGKDSLPGRPGRGADAGDRRGDSGAAGAAGGDRARPGRRAALGAGAQGPGPAPDRRAETAGAHVYIPRRDQGYAIEAGLRMLSLRHLVDERDGLYAARPEEMHVLRYYANSLAHLVPEAGGAGQPST